MSIKNRIFDQKKLYDRKNVLRGNIKHSVNYQKKHWKNKCIYILKADKEEKLVAMSSEARLAEVRDDKLRGKLSL